MRTKPPITQISPIQPTCRNVRVVYASTSLALAAIETFVNLEPSLRPDDRVSVAGDIPAELEVARLALNDLPRNWNLKRESTRRFGDEFIRAKRYLAILVPSAAIRGERNLLLNPVHPDFSKIKLAKPVAFDFDPRMFR